MIVFCDQCAGISFRYRRETRMDVVYYSTS